jgi:hypothetical protein
MHEAGVRSHGTTRAQPLALYTLERALLKPLPAVAPDLGSWHRVVLHRDCQVQHERAFYSAPLRPGGQDPVAARHRHGGGAATFERVSAWSNLVLRATAGQGRNVVLGLAEQLAANRLPAHS